MRKFRILVPLVGLVFLAGTGLLTNPAFAADYVAAPLSGGEEVPPNDSKARGNATFDVSDDGTEITFKLIVANINNVVAAHIHIAPVGTNGGVVAFLYGNAPAGGGPANGVLSEGTITAANLVGTLAGQPLSALISAMQAGNAYVNVHTNDGVAPTNTGPGDIPGGEIRAQIRPGGGEE